MDKCTHEVRLQNWKNIIKQCQSRPEGQTARQWMKENNICEPTYYLWQRRIRQETYEQMNSSLEMLPSVSKQDDVTFAEITMPSECVVKEPHFNQDTDITPVAILKVDGVSIGISNNISEKLLRTILQEVSNA